MSFLCVVVCLQQGPSNGSRGDGFHLAAADRVRHCVVWPRDWTVCAVANRTLCKNSVSGEVFCMHNTEGGVTCVTCCNICVHKQPWSCGRHTVQMLYVAWFCRVIAFGIVMHIGSRSRTVTAARAKRTDTAARVDHRRLEPDAPVIVAHVHHQCWRNNHPCF